MVVSRNTLERGDLVWTSRSRLLLLPESVVQGLTRGIQGQTRKTLFVGALLIVKI